MTTTQEPPFATGMDQPPEVRRVDDETRTERKVHIGLAPMAPRLVPEEFSVQRGVYIRPDLLTATVIDGDLVTVSLAGQLCAADGTPKPYERPAPGARYPQSRQQTYYVWGGKPTSEPIPPWVRELLAEQRVTLP